MTEKKSKINLKSWIFVVCSIMLFLACLAGSIAFFQYRNNLSLGLDIKPIVITDAEEYRFSAKMNSDMIGRKLLANDVKFRTSKDLKESIYVRCAFLVDTKDAELGGSTLYQDSYIPTNTSSLIWKQYKDYYYLCSKTSDAPIKLSKSDSSTTYTFLEEESLFLPSFLSADFFSILSCDVTFVLESIDSANFDSDPTTPEQVESKSMTPTTPQTHSVEFFDCEGSLISKYTVAHGGSVVSNIPDSTQLKIPTGYELLNFNTQHELLGATMTEAKLGNIITDLKLYPKVGLKKFTITINNGEGGTSTPTGTTKVGYGEDLSIFFEPNEGFVIADISVDGESKGVINSYYFENVTSDHAVNATYKTKQLNVSAIVTGPGEVSPTYQLVDYNQSCSFSVTPNEGAYIASLKINGVAQSGFPMSVGGKITSKTISNITEDQIIEVVFESGLFSITISGENFEVAGKTTSIVRGSDLTLKITPKEGYRLVKFVVDGTDVPCNVTHGQADSYTFKNICENHTLQVVTEANTYVVTASVKSGQSALGTISPATANVVRGANHTLTITPKEGYEVNALLVDGVQVSSSSNMTSYTLNNVTKNTNVVVEFKNIEKTVYATLSSNGQLSSNVGSTKIVGPSNNQTWLVCNYGTSIKVTATPTSGYKLSSFKVKDLSTGTEKVHSISGVAAGSSYSCDIVLKQDILITVEFVQHIFNLNVIEITEKTDGTFAASQDGGTVSGDGNVNYGDPINLVVNTNQGFEFDGFYSDSACTTTMSVPTIMPNSPLTIYAKFNRLEYLFEIEEIYEDENGNIKVGNVGGEAAESRQIKFGTTISPRTTVARDGFTFTGYYSDMAGQNKATVPQTMPSNTLKFYAKFERGVTKIYIIENKGNQTKIEKTGKIGSQATVDAPTWDGYDFIGWQVTDGTNVLAQAGESYADLSLGSIEANGQLASVTFGSLGGLTLVAEWKAKQYTLTIDPKGGAYTDASQGYESAFTNIKITGHIGDTYSLTTPTQPKSEFKNWTKTDGAGTLSGNTFTFGAGDATVEAEWVGVQKTLTIINQYETLTGAYTNGALGGTVLGGGKMPIGSTISLTPTPADGFEFVGYTSSVPDTLEEDLTITAQFKRKIYSVTLNITYENADGQLTTVADNNTASQTIGPAGTITVTAPHTSLKFGADFTISATAKTGYTAIVSESATLSGNKTTISIKMPASDKTIYVRFAVAYSNLTITNNSTGASRTITQRMGTTYSPLATDEQPANQLAQTFKQWTHSGGGRWTSSTKTFTFGATDGTLTAEFNDILYTLTINPDGWTYEGKTTQIKIEGLKYNETKYLSTPTKSGYTFSGWKVTEGSATINGQQVTVKGNATITPNGKLNTYEVLVFICTQNVSGSYITNNSDGVSSITGTGSFVYGTHTKLALTIKEGFVFDGFFSNSSLTGTAVSTDNPYTVKVTGRIALYAKISRKTTTVTITADQGGKYNGATPISRRFGDVVEIDSTKFSWTNNTNLVFNTLALTSGQGTGTLKNNNNGTYTYTFGAKNGTLVASPRTKTASYRILVYTENTQSGIPAGANITATLSSGANALLNSTTYIPVASGTTLTITVTHGTLYRFKAFYTKLQGGTFSGEITATGTEEVKTLTQTITEDYLVYIRFIPKTINVTLKDGDNPLETITNIAISSVVDTTINEKYGIPTKSGKDFLGFTYTNSKGTFYVSAPVLSKKQPNSLTYGSITVGSTTYSGYMTLLFQVVAGQTYSIRLGGVVPSQSSSDFLWVAYASDGSRSVSQQHSFSPSQNDLLCGLILKNNTTFDVFMGNEQQFTADLFGGAENITLQAQWADAKRFITFDVWTTDHVGNYKQSVGGGENGCGPHAKDSSMSTALIVSSPTQTMIWNASGGGTISAPVDTNDGNVFLYDLYLMNALSEASVLSLTTSTRNLSRESGSLTLTNETMSSNTPYVVYVHYKAKIILNKNNASVRVDNLNKITIQVADNGAFTMTDHSNEELPGTSDGGVFYYFSTNSTSSISGQKGVRYDIGTGYQHKLNLALTDSFVLYAIYMKSYSSYSSSGFAQQYLAIPMGTTELSARNMSTFLTTKYMNGLGLTYRPIWTSDANSTTKYVTLPRGFTTLGLRALEFCSGIQGISFPSHSFTTFGDYACSYTALKNSSGDSVFFDVPKTTTAIGKEFISHTTALTSVTIGANIPYSSSGLSESTALHIHAFTNAPNLIRINGEGNYSSDDGILTDQYKHEYIRCPEGKTNVSDEWGYWTIWEYCFNNVAAKTISFWGGTLTAKTNAFSGMKGEELILHMTNKLDLKEGSIVNCSELLRLEFGTTYTDSSTTYTNAIGSLPKIEKIIFNKKGSATPASYTLSTIRSGVSWYYAASETDPVNSTATHIINAGIYTTRQIPNKPVLVETYSSDTARNTAFNSPNSNYEHTSGRTGSGYFSTLNEAFSMAKDKISIVTLFGDTTLTSTLNISANTDMLITTWDAGCVIKRGTSDVLFNIDGGKLTFDSQNLIVDGQNSNSTYKTSSLVYIKPSGIFNFTNGTLQNNNATNGGAVYIDEYATANINGGTIQGCVASTSGGAIYSEGELSILGGNISGTASGYKILDIDASMGGAIAVSDGTCMISGGTISGIATAAGGGVAVTNGTLTMDKKACITNSKAGRFGGGIYIALSGGFTLSGGTISDNEADNESDVAYGGGIALCGNSKAIISGGRIIGNDADFGGGVYVSMSAWDDVNKRAYALIEGGTITGNNAWNCGGGIYLAAATGSGKNITRSLLSVLGATISSNNASEGGGIYADEGSQLFLSHCTKTTAAPTISTNTAYYGGGIYLYHTNKFHLWNQTIISSNTATYDGGGIYSTNSDDNESEFFISTSRHTEEDYVAAYNLNMRPQIINNMLTSNTSGGAGMYLENINHMYSALCDFDLYGNSGSAVQLYYNSTSSSGSSNTDVLPIGGITKISGTIYMNNSHITSPDPYSGDAITYFANNNWIANIKKDCNIMTEANKLNIFNADNTNGIFEKSGDVYYVKEDYLQNISIYGGLGQDNIKAYLTYNVGYNLRVAQINYHIRRTSSSKSWFNLLYKTDNGFGYSYY